MGKGIDAARALDPEAAALMEDLRDHLLIVFLKRLGGKAAIPVAEVDNTGSDVLTMSVRDGVFTFEVRKKS